MCLGPPCPGYALNCRFCLAIPMTHQLLLRKQNLLYKYAPAENEIHICSNKHETGLVREKEVHMKTDILF